MTEQEAIGVLRVMAKIVGHRAIARLEYRGQLYGYALGDWTNWTRFERRMIWTARDGLLSERRLSALPHKAKAVQCILSGAMLIAPENR